MIYKNQKINHDNRNKQIKKGTRESDNGLKKSEIMYGTLMKIFPDAVTATDLNGIIISLSKRTLKLHGFKKASDLIGRNAFELIYPEDREKALANMRKTLEGGSTRNVEYTLLRKDGSRFIGEISTSLIKDNNGNPEAFISITSDITDRKLSEARLLESEEKYRALFEQAADSIVLIDANTAQLLDFNDRTHKNLGYTRREFKKLKLSDFDVIENAKEIADHLRKVIRKGSDVFETKHKTKSGDIRNIFVSARAINIQGKDYIHSIWRDITEHKRADEALKESEEKFRTLAEQSPNMIFINYRGKIVYVNRKSEELMGYSEEEFYADDFNFLTLIASESVELVKASFKRHSEGKEVEPFEYTIITKHGKKSEVIITTKLIDYERDTAILGIITDITERKKAEAELRQSQKLASIGQLSAGLAHEINNPLSALSGEVQWLMEKNKDKKLLKSLRFIYRVSERISRIINNLLIFSHETSEKTKEPVNINSLLNKTLLLVKRNFRINSIKVKKNLKKDIPDLIANRGDFEQIFINILKNCADAMPDGGELNIITRLTKSDKAVEIIFQDTGIGIAKENLARVLDPFYTTKPPGMGTGLGLSVTHGILKNYAGTIKIKSELNKGTNVIIRFPVKQSS